MTLEVTESHRLPVLLGLAEMVDLFPRSKTTVYRWRTARRGKAPELPAPDAVVSGTPLWREDVILAFARDRGMEPDPEVLTEIRRTQGHP